ncbi:hypothetical protein CLOM_g913 [Closterium sp. NIES-68]|nr:hypothetical protein CLOM_g913 [Closterium sp. NIES-68]GJP75364.1 hypothetical protein CLOP_g5820 [Closterium sp. NIES-67]
MWNGEEEEDDKVCHTRAEYRAGNRERAVRVYTVNDESRCLMVRNVPALGCADDLIRLFAAHGPIHQHRMMDEEDAAPFTDVVWIKFAHINHARFAKRKLDDYPFMGSALEVSYLPGHEAMEDTWAKLEERRRIVAVRCRRLAEEQAGTQRDGRQDDGRADANHREAHGGMGDGAHAPTSASASASKSTSASAAAACAGTIPSLAPLPPARPPLRAAPTHFPPGIPPFCQHTCPQLAQPHQQPCQPHQQLCHPRQQPPPSPFQHPEISGRAFPLPVSLAQGPAQATRHGHGSMDSAGNSLVENTSLGNSSNDPPCSSEQPCGSTRPSRPAQYSSVPSMDATAALVRSRLTALHPPAEASLATTIALSPSSQQGAASSQGPGSTGDSHAREAAGHCGASGCAQGTAAGRDLASHDARIVAPQPHVQCVPGDNATGNAGVAQPTKKKRRRI